MLVDETVAVDSVLPIQACGSRSVLFIYVPINSPIKIYINSSFRNYQMVWTEKYRTNKL